MINITLVPRLLPKTSNLETHLRLDRIDIASKWLGMDFKKVFIDSLSSGMQEVYDQYRWVIIPHILAADCLVIYALPRWINQIIGLGKAWYTDGITPIIHHHVHYIAKKTNTTGKWSEGPGAVSY